MENEISDIEKMTREQLIIVILLPNNNLKSLSTIQLYLSTYEMGAQCIWPKQGERSAAYRYFADLVKAR